MKTQEELTQLKKEYETINNKLQELSEDEASMVIGSAGNRNVGLVYQQYSLFPHLRVYDGHSQNDQQTADRIMRDARIAEIEKKTNS